MVRKTILVTILLGLVNLAGPVGANSSSASDAAQVGGITATDSVKVSHRHNQSMTPQTAADCLYYLRLAGYTITAKMTEACKAGTDGIGSEAICRAILRATEVAPYHAANACKLAAAD